MSTEQIVAVSAVIVIAIFAVLVCVISAVSSAVGIKQTQDEDSES